jgi:hypothetical protein
MNTKLIRTLLSTAVLAMVASSSALPQEAQLVRILGESGLWGQDWPAALASLPAWRQAGEQTVEIFLHRVVGATQYDNRETAQRTTDKLVRAMEQPRPDINPAFASRLEQYLREQPLRAEANTDVLAQGARSFQVAFGAPSLQFLASELTVARVGRLLGQPENVTTVAVQTYSDRRPEILTLHAYAGGNIAFAESDLAPSPGLVDRVLLKLPAATAAVFREVP